jgi:hypothetical protein
MVINAGFLGAKTIFLLAPAGNSDARHIPILLLLSDSPCEFVSVYLWHSNIQEHHRRIDAADCFERSQAIVYGPDVGSQTPQERTEDVGRISVVINHQNPADCHRDRKTPGAILVRQAGRVLC